MSKKRPHVASLVRIQGWLVRVFGNEFVNVEAPIEVSPEDDPTSEPEPDFIVLSRHSDLFDANPKPSELQLVVEVAEASLAGDLGPKAGLYGRAGILEYWVAGVAGRRFFVHRALGTANIEPSSNSEPAIGFLPWPRLPRTSPSATPSARSRHRPSC